MKEISLTITEISGKEMQNDEIKLISDQLQGEKIKLEKQKQDIESESKQKDEKITALQQKIERQNSHNSNGTLPTTTETPKMPYSLMEHAISGLVFCVLGVIIALVTKVGICRCSPPLDQDQVDTSPLRCHCVSLS